MGSPTGLINPAGGIHLGGLYCYSLKGLPRALMWNIHELESILLEGGEYRGVLYWGVLKELLRWILGV